MRKFLTILLVCGLVLLCACDKQTQDADKPQDTLTGNYKAAVAAIDSGDYRTAYDLLKNATDEQSKELLTHFVFVPTYDALTTQHETADDMHFSTELVLDEQGNIIKQVITDKGDITENTYTYDAHRRIVKEKSSSDGYLRIATYTYDETGKLIHKQTAIEIPNSSRINDTRYTYTYDENDNVTQEKVVNTHVATEGAKTTTETTKTVTEYKYRYHETGKVILKKTIFDAGDWGEDETKDPADSELDEDETEYPSYSDWEEIETEYRADGTLYKVTECTSYNPKQHVDEYDEQERLYKEWVIEEDGYTYASRTYHYNTEGRLVQIDRYPAAVNFPGTVTYEYDDKGNLLCETEGTQKTTYTYDEDSNCLTTVCTGTNYDWNKRYTYDKQGRLIEEVTTYAREDSTPYTVALTYDADGNKATETQTGMSSEGFGLTTYNRTLTWTLYYYPDGVPEMVQEEIDDALRYDEFL